MQQKKYSSVFCLLLFLSAFHPLVAQVPGYSNFLPDDNDTKISTLFKSRDGYILVGTSAGLYKFDGKRLKPVATDKPGLADTVTAIFQDRSNTIWVGYQSGHIAKTSNGKLQYIDPDEGLPKKRITSFIQDGKNNIWFGTRGEGIYYFNDKRLYLVNEENGLTDLNIHSLSATANGYILAATDQGLVVCNTTAVQKKVSTIGPAQGLPDYIVTSITPAGGDDFWIGLQEKGICLYNHNTKRITVPAAIAAWDKGQVNALYYTHNNVWITTQDSGLFCYAPSGNHVASVPLLSPSQKSTSSIIEDNQGNMWFVADNHSLVRASCNALQMHPVYNEDFFATVHAILVDHEGNYWTGTDKAIVKYSRNDNGYQSKKYAIAGLDIKTDITSLYEDRFFNIWIGTMGSGLYVLDPQTGISRQLKEAPVTGSILSITGNVNTICTAGLEGAMLFELTEDNAAVANAYRHTSYNNIQNIGSTYIYNVFKDSKGKIWFATDGKGLTVLNNGNFIHYDKRSGIKDEHIYSITEDVKGDIWFSTANSGIYCFNGKAFTNYSVKEGLSSLAVSAIKTDRQGNIIVVHKDGIDIINAGTKNFSYIDATQGITTINDDLGAVCTDRNGDVFVSTKKGILQYTALEGVLTTPQTVIESVQLFLNDIDTAAIHQFEYDENNIRFNFTGLYYTNPDDIFYQFKLEGLDSNWQFTGDNSKAFPKLPPGKYTFRVRAALNKNFKNVSEASYAFQISKPWWKTWWFVTGCFAIFGGLLYWYIRRREAHLTHVARLQSEKIKFEFEVLRNQVNPHFLFNSFNTLISTIETDSKAAVEYVEQLSDFFRNIVNYRGHNTISLKEEISLLQNYLYLQQKRYGVNLQLAIEVDEAAQEVIYLPPLTLQLLSENAIKHNVVSKEAVLLIQITAAEGYVTVKNNINKKINPEKGTGMGLENIVNRYALLDERPVAIVNTGQDFIVRLPILKQH